MKNKKEIFVNFLQKKKWDIVANMIKYTYFYVDWQKLVINAIDLTNTYDDYDIDKLNYCLELLTKNYNLDKEDKLKIIKYASIYGTFRLLYGILFYLKEYDSDISKEYKQNLINQITNYPDWNVSNTLSQLKENLPANYYENIFKVVYDKEWRKSILDNLLQRNISADLRNKIAIYKIR